MRRHGSSDRHAPFRRKSSVSAVNANMTTNATPASVTAATGTRFERRPEEVPAKTGAHLDRTRVCQSLLLFLLLPRLPFLAPSQETSMSVSSSVTPAAAATAAVAAATGARFDDSSGGGPWYSFTVFIDPDVTAVAFQHLQPSTAVFGTTLALVVSSCPGEDKIKAKQEIDSEYREYMA